MAATSSLRTHVQKFARGGQLHSLGMQLLAAMSVLMIAAIILMSLTLSHLKGTRQLLKDTEDTLLQITTVESRIMDFDGALSSYTLSGVPWFERRMKDDTTEEHTALEKLRVTLRNDREQMARYEDLVSIAREREQIYAYLRLHREEVAGSPTALKARQATDRMRGMLWQILDTERAKRAVNQDKMIAEAQRSFWIAVGIVLLTALFGGCCLILAGAAPATRPRAD